MDDKQDITITINVRMARNDADTLAEFLHEMIRDMMKIETVVSYVIDADNSAHIMPTFIGEE